MSLLAAISKSKDFTCCCSFRAKVDRGEIVIGADEWPVFLYDEDIINPEKEWIGLFLGETFVHVSLSC